MIQIYNQDNLNYDANGDKVLFPFACSLVMELNGDWELAAEFPVDDGGDWKLITKEAVFSVPTPVSERQLFRIYNTVITDQQITAYAKPIFLDSAHEVYLLNRSASYKNGQDILNVLTEGTKYKGISNIKNTSSSYWDRENLIEALASNNENSFLNCWGGEILYDNYTVIINKRAGGDYGTTIRTGKNLSGIKEEVNMDEVITRVVPVAYNGHMLAGSEPWVDSPLIDNYSVVYTREVEFTDVKLTEETSTDEACTYDTLDDLRRELTRRANLLFSENQIDLPKISYHIDLTYLADTQEYKEYGVLERVGLGDTVYCRHRGLGITTSARVIKLEYDCVLKQIKNIELGAFQYDYFKRVTNAETKINNIVNNNGNIMADRIAGIIDATVTQLRLQADIAKKIEYRAILIEDLDPESPTFGAICFGTQGWEIASERTADGKDWAWKTAATSKGVVADAVVTGLLSDKTGKNYWDLDTGEFRLSMDNLHMDDRRFDEYISEMAGKEVDKSRVINVILSNEFHAVPTDENGNDGNYSGCECSAQIFWGNTDITSNPNVTCEIEVSNGITGIYNSGAKKYRVSNMESDTGYLDFHVTYSGVSITRRFDISKNKKGTTGTDGRIYAIEVDAVTITRGETGIYTPPKVTFYAYYRDGQSAIQNDYSGRLVIEESGDGITWITKYTSNSDEALKIYTPSTSAKTIKCTMYAAGGTTTKLDVQSVTIVDDITSLTQEVVFNKLTDNGRLKGIYMDNGELYINFTYAKGGTLKLGGSNDVNGAMQVLDANGNIVTKLDQNGIETSSAKITGGTIKINTSSANYSAIQLKYNNYEIDLSAGGLFSYSATESALFYPGSIVLSSNSTPFFIANDANIVIKSEDVVIYNDLHVYGRKNRVIATEEYGNLFLNAYEMPQAYFGDMGIGKIQRNGKIEIKVDERFIRATEGGFLVFLQAEAGEVKLEYRKEESFVVSGVPDTVFFWEIKAMQRGYANRRF